MKINDIITLTQAGWTKDEIMSLVNGEAQDPAQPTDPQPEAQSAQQPEQTSQPAEVKPDDDRLNKLETKLDYVINRFNYLAVQQSQQPEQKAESVEDILASVVRGTQPDKQK